MSPALSMVMAFGAVCLVALIGMLVAAWRDPEVRRWIAGGVRRFHDPAPSLSLRRRDERERTEFADNDASPDPRAERLGDSFGDLGSGRVP